MAVELSSAGASSSGFRRVVNVAGLVLAAAAGASAAFLPDPFAPMAVACVVGLFFFAALSPTPTALAVVAVSTIPGILSRVQLVSVGIKAVALRPEEAAVLGLCAGHGLRLLRRRPGSTIERTWLLFTALLGLSLLFSLRLWSVSEQAVGLLYATRWLLFGAVLWAAAEEAQRGVAHQQRLLRLIVFSALMLSAFGFLQYLFLPNMADLKAAFPQIAEVLTDPHEERLVSTVLDPNLLGALLAPAIAIAFARALNAGPAQRARAYAPVAVLLAAILLTVSRGTLLSAAIGCAVVAVLTAPRLLWGFVLLVPGVAISAPRLFSRFGEALWAPGGVPLTLLGLKFQPEPSAFARIKSWLAASRIIEEHPLWGVGYNNYGLALLKHHEEGAVLYGTDSSLLHMLATCGLVGFAAYLLLLGRIVRSAYVAGQSDTGPERAMGVGIVGALAAMLTASVFTNALSYPPVLIYLWLMAGTASALHAKRPSAAKVPADLRDEPSPHIAARGSTVSLPPRKRRDESVSRDA